ncbi:D-alanyl-D-alanine carboxypeptidase DD-carboxypeptidase [Fibrella aestuarina BUZ 2]|uniref:D-alanyl-D-alanine carboxypeptidase DD-carboxypeptidase n=1 Tax=Fibrella aestuarina BUZ 2 TaxID=1166018 RepID=I0KCZ5_9BACT|nr:serine hydrolase [Fibrella aestuarina]CCH01998.1 D-alanyl-D-alanine carboxypeptidase DD-carboxypeptidase [Fibrella aestuarina BUZ 2]
MSTTVYRLCRISLAFFGLLPVYHSIAQPPKRLADRIAAVERSLIPYVPVAGLKGWTIEERMKLYKVPGVSVAVIHNYKLDWVKAYGLADTTARKPVTTETLFSAGSISKLVAAVAALKLVEQGKLTLDAPINTYLKSWQLGENDKTRQTPVTLRMLLSHRGGTSQSAYFGFTPDKNPLPSVPDMLAGKPDTDSRPVVVNGVPGAGFNYSGGGYLVAQMAMMDITGKDFATLADELIFRPLGMKGASFAQPLPSSLASRLAWAYSPNGWFKGMPYLYPQQAAAGLHCTPTDLAKLIIDLQNSYRGTGKLLSQGSMKAMVTPLAPVSDGFFDEQIGLGAFLLQQKGNTSQQGRYFEHTGVNAGYLAYALGSVVGGNGVVVMMNDNAGANELGKEIRRAVAQVYAWPGFLPEPLVPISLPDSLLNAYVGRYQRGPDEVVTIRRSGKLLTETINNGNSIICVPIGRDTIALTDYTAKAYFSRAALGRTMTEGTRLGRIDSLRLEWDKMPWPRLAEGVYLPNELMRMGRLPEAVEGYRTMKLNVYQLTYMAYDLTTSRPANLPAAEAILALARQQFPKEGIVYTRLGDLYMLRGETSRAIDSFREALKLDSSDAYSKDKLKALKSE